MRRSMGLAAVITVVTSLTASLTAAVTAFTAQAAAAAPVPGPRGTAAVEPAGGLPDTIAVEPAGRLPIGPGWLPESRHTRTLAPGLTFTTITRGFPDPARQFWTIGVNIPVGEVPPDPDPDADQGAMGTYERAAAVARQLEDDPAVARELAARGWRPTIDPVDYAPRMIGYRGGLIGYTLRIGRYETRPPADDSLLAALAAGGFRAAPVHTGQDGRPDATGPWVVRVLTVDPRRFSGRVGASVGDAVSGRENTSAMARAAGAVAAVNGGFFTIGAGDGTPGVPAGLTVVDGRSLTAATAGRPVLVLRGDGTAAVTTLRDRHRLTVAGGGRAAGHPVDGLNRPPGLVRNCGGTGGDRPTERPVHDFTCTDPDELVVLTPRYGAAPPEGTGIEAVVGADGTVTVVRPRTGLPAPPGATVVQATGAAADWLSRHAAPGRRIRVDTTVTDERGRPVRFGPRDSVVNGGPRLVSGGRVSIDPGRDGLLHEDPDLHLPSSALGASFGYAWFIRDNPRTGAGVDARGRLLLVQVDGRQETYSQGLPIKPFADVLRALGAVEAVNLDGGGSSATVVDGRLVSSPSDTDADGDRVERAVGDAIVVTGTGRS
jgi:hypothetical protein